MYLTTRALCVAAGTVKTERKTAKNEAKKERRAEQRLAGAGRPLSKPSSRSHCLAIYTTPVH
jgi:hypothetical protein